MSERYWAKTRYEFDALVAQAKARYAGPMARLSLHDLVGMQEALSEAIDAIKPEAHAEDVRRGHRPPGTKVGAR